MTKPLVIGIAGASGFIGRNLIKQIIQKTDFEVVGFCRDARGQRWSDRVSWRSCDLFSLLDADAGLRGVDVAIYLVHSMLPSAQLSQGHFRDFDLIMADNFQRAARNQGVKKIIYLSGIIPDVPRLSDHLESRLEVEDTLKASGVPTTSFRCGLILGQYGSSFEMMAKLVERLPLMICPAWTASHCQPVDLDDVLDALVNEVKISEGRVVNLVGPKSVPYIELLKLTAKYQNKKFLYFNVPYFSPSISTLWVSLISGAPLSLVNPLVKSLKHQMDIEHSVPVDEIITAPTTLDESLKKSLGEFKKRKLNKHIRVYRPRVDSEEVRSVQRFILPEGKNASWVAEEYNSWLPKYLSFIVFKVGNENGDIVFKLFGAIKLLILRPSPERSSNERQLYYIVGGVLADFSGRGRLEFRETADRKFILAAIHEFRPNLPWFIYSYSQALVHLVVMKAFGRHLWKIHQKTQSDLSKKHLVS